jgi:hypothetical protein
MAMQFDPNDYDPEQVGQAREVIQSIYRFKTQVLDPVAAHTADEVPIGLLDQMRQTVSEQVAEEFAAKWGPFTYAVLMGEWEALQLMLSGVQQEFIGGPDITVALMVLGSTVVAHASLFFDIFLTSEDGWIGTDELEGMMEDE